MRLLLLSGGSGKRLWPLSNDSRSKQFLKILRNDEGELESMVQRVWGQLQRSGLAGLTSIATSRGQIDILYSQIGAEPSYILEPDRRDTFPAIALSAVYFYQVLGASLDETMCVLPVDPYVEESFFHNIQKLDEVIQRGEAELALIGVAPTHPSEKYGYIIPQSERMASERSFRKVERFIEKPREELAAQLITDGALWNCGVFAFRLGYLLSIVELLGMPLDFETLTKQYAKLPKGSFDYEVVEKADRIAAIPYKGYWKDIGTWNTLTEEMKSNVTGRAVVSEGTNNTHVINELDIPITVLGASNIVVAASPDGILVAEKSVSHQVKDWISQWSDQPMYVERRWGCYKILDHKHDEDGQEVLTKMVILYRGSHLSYHVHYKRSEHWVIVSGRGRVVIDGVLRDVTVGESVQISAGTMHSIYAIEQMEFIEVQLGSEIYEEDVKRTAFDWDSIVSISASQ